MTRTPWHLVVTLADALGMWPCGRDALDLARSAHHDAERLARALDDARKEAMADTERIARVA